MKLKKITALICAAMLAASAFAGCGSSSDSADSSAASSAESTAASEASEEAETTEAVKGDDVMTIASIQGSATLDPLNGYDYWYMLRYGVCETLFKFDENMTPQSWLAEEEYTLSDDQRTWTFTIKDGITFSNGTEVTADAVKQSIEYALENSQVAASYIDVETIEADGQTLSITTVDPNPILIYYMADPIFCIYDVTVDLTNIADEGPIGTGPFVFESFDVSNGNVSVVRNESYWDGTVALAGIDFNILTDPASAYFALSGGTVDAAYGLDMTNVNELTGNSDFNILSVASGRTDFGFMNLDGVLEDKVLRQAIMQACDKETYAESLLLGQFDPGITPLSSALPYGYDELTDVNAYDPENAAKILDEAGYEDTNGDGYRETPDGEEFEITITTFSGRAEIPTLAAAMQMDCKEVGIHLEIQNLEQSVAWNNLTSGEYEILLMSISMCPSGDPAGILQTYFGTYDEENPNYNKSGYSNEEVDALFEELKSTFDTDERIEKIKEIEQLMMDDSACMYLAYPQLNFCTKATVTGITNTISDYYWVSAETGFTE
ncbi:MAG: ABC transporter substrate-binding protein [Lachnospiraceae bacterium]|nr:ABC transporter substrate-binding protein [Lachnospiraceae bacterium]